MAKKIILSKTQQCEVDKQKVIQKINAIIPLHKVGINWFGKCIFCNDPGSHFCVPDAADRVICFNGNGWNKCKVTWTIDEFFNKVNDNSK